MKKNIKELSLLDCLKWAGVPRLPEVDDKENIWIRAIALVQKADGSQSYVVMGRDDVLEHTYIKDFGNISLIREVLSIHPYDFLVEANMPMFKTKKREERIEWLKKFIKDKDFESMSLKELDKRVAALAMKSQLAKRIKK